MSRFACLIVCVVAVSLHSAYAISEEEKAAFRDAIQPTIAECSQAYGVSQADINSAKKAGNADGINSCFMGCALKKAKIINQEGIYDLDSSLQLLKKYIKDGSDITKFEKIAKQCVSVNDQAVSDGTAGCERAQRLVSCFLEHKTELPL